MPDESKGTGDRAVDPVLPGVRRHEDFDTSYRTGTPPWDIGRPQAAFVRLLEAGEVRGQVLDVGCGTRQRLPVLDGRLARRTIELATTRASGTRSRVVARRWAACRATV